MKETDSDFTVSSASLAKLLANENIQVQWGKFETASFSTIRRLLCMPIMKGMSKDLMDMFLGHEVGHALWTKQGSEAEANIKKMMSTVNIVEDARIEKMIKSKYPGLGPIFIRAYRELLERDFFGLSRVDHDFSKLCFMDRINLKAKCGELLDIPFSPEEKEIFDRVLATETWEEVVELSEELYERHRGDERQDPEKQASQAECECEGEEEGERGSGNSDSYEDEDGEPEDSKDGESADGESDEKSDGESDEKSDGESDEKSDEDPVGDCQGNDLDKDNSDESDDGEESSSGENEEDESDDKADAGDNVKSDEEAKDKDSADSDKASEDGSSKAKDSEPETITDKALDENFRKAAADSNENRDSIDVYFPTHKQSLAQIIGYREYLAEFGEHYSDESRFVDYWNKTRKYANLISKEFDRKKAAYQYSRAQEGRTGVINTERLHNYKFDDQIFKTTTQLANAKSHGLIMFIDYSGSMASVIKNVVLHTINLAMFCHQSNIPFEVYGFTTGGKDNPLPYRDHTMNIDNLKCFEMLSNKMKKSEFKKAVRHLWEGSWNKYSSNLAGTPLLETIAVAHALTKKFKETNRIQVPTIVFLTDGSGHYIRHHVDASLYNGKIPAEDNMLYHRKIRIHESNTSSFEVLAKGDSTYVGTDRFQAEMFENLKKKTGSNLIGFYLTSRVKARRRRSYYGYTSETNPVVAHLTDAIKKSKSSAVRKKAQKVGAKKLALQLKETQFDLNQMAIVNEVYGYDAWFIIPTSSMDTHDIELNVNSDMNRGRIAREFSKAHSGKKADRLFATKFAEIISESYK